MQTSDQRSESAGFKVLVLGDSHVGKTSLIDRLVFDSFEPVYNRTRGVNVLNHRVTSHLDHSSVRLGLWDKSSTLGEARDRSFILSAHCCLVLYDITVRESFVHASTHIDSVKGYRSEEVAIFLVGMKADLSDTRVISAEEGQVEAVRAGAHFVELSAKTGDNVRDFFSTVTTMLLDRSWCQRLVVIIEPMSTGADSLELVCRNVGGSIMASLTVGSQETLEEFSVRLSEHIGIHKGKLVLTLSDGRVFSKDDESNPVSQLVDATSAVP